MMTIRALFAAALFGTAIPASAQNLDWSKDPAAQVRSLLSALAAPAYYSGTMTVRGETRAICFSLSPEKIDRYAGDPDISQGVFVYQYVPVFRESGQGSCDTSLEHNGDYLRACSGLFLVGIASLEKGQVFTKLERFDPVTGELILKPEGTFELKRADGCSKR